MDGLLSVATTQPLARKRRGGFHGILVLIAPSVRGGICSGALGEDFRRVGRLNPARCSAKATFMIVRCNANPQVTLANGLLPVADGVGAVLAVTLLVGVDDDLANLPGVVAKHEQADIVGIDFI